jgi:hypothetical protein|tara:strand:- start:1111 stop:1224 length:114 start_codon:yes stop_codon:yes gene_type:complete
MSLTWRFTSVDDQLTGSPGQVVGFRGTENHHDSLAQE